MRGRKLFTGLVKIPVRLGLRRQGKNLGEINDLMEGLSPELIDSAVAMSSGITMPSFWDDDIQDGSDIITVGDRPIIDAILKFLQSDTGRALIQAIVSLLLGLFIV